MRVLILVSLCLVLACTKQEASPEPEPDTPPTVAAEAATGATPSDGAAAPADQAATASSLVPRPKLTLDSAGAAPRHALRWQFRKGMEATVEVSMAMHVDLTMDGQPQPASPTPAILTTLDLVIQSVDDAGTALIDFTATKIGVGEDKEVPQAARAQIEADLQTIVGLRGSYRCEASGFVPEVETRLPPQASAAVQQAVENIRQALRQMTVLLPEEPVGRGAKWTLAAEYPFSGMQVTERATYTLKKVKLPNVVATVSIEQTAPPQTLTGSDGRSGELDGLQSEATGSNRWNLELFSPIAASRKTSMSMTMKGPGDDGQTHEVTLAIDIDLRVESQ